MHKTKLLTAEGVREKRRWRAALQNLAAFRERLVNAPASWSAERQFRFGPEQHPK
jgi:hypothetical protein